VAACIGLYALVLGMAVATPRTFEGLLRDFSTGLSAEAATGQRELAVAALTSPTPLLIEIVVGLVFLFIAAGGGGRFRPFPVGERRISFAAEGLVLLAVIPLAFFAPSINPRRSIEAFDFGASPFVQALRQEEAHRILTIGEPGWYGGMPNQLAMAGVADVRMFSSLNLAASDRLLAELRTAPDASALRQAVGIDRIVTFGQACGGEPVGRVAEDDAYICRVPGAMRPPYWLPAAAVTQVDAEGALPVLVRDATVDLAAAVGSGVPAQVVDWQPENGLFIIEAPEDGYVYIDRAWWPAWQSWVDGRPVAADRALGGQLIAVPAGRHVVEMALWPWEAFLGLLIGVVAVLVALRWARVLPLSHRTPAASSGEVAAVEGRPPAESQ
jgi:hypothetical protein